MRLREARDIVLVHMNYLGPIYVFLLLAAITLSAAAVLLGKLVQKIIA
jgi:hypothetical protein